MAGTDNIEDWRIIKDDQLEALSPRSVQLSAKNKKAFVTEKSGDKPIISDEEWNELKDIFG